jgi:hypothetical protein
MCFKPWPTATLWWEPILDSAHMAWRSVANVMLKLASASSLGGVGACPGKVKRPSLLLPARFGIGRSSQGTRTQMRPS